MIPDIMKDWLVGMCQKDIYRDNRSNIYPFKLTKYY